VLRNVCQQFVTPQKILLVPIYLPNPKFLDGMQRRKLAESHWFKLSPLQTVYVYIRPTCTPCHKDSQRWPFMELVNVVSVLQWGHARATCRRRKKKFSCSILKLSYGMIASVVWIIAGYYRSRI